MSKDIDPGAVMLRCADGTAYTSDPGAAVGQRIAFLSKGVKPKGSAATEDVTGEATIYHSGGVVKVAVASKA